MSRGREAIEGVYAATLNNLGGHYTIVIKDAIPLSSDVVVATDEVKIAGVGQHSDETIDARAMGGKSRHSIADHVGESPD